jgi:hypothetical protein
MSPSRVNALAAHFMTRVISKMVNKRNGKQQDYLHHAPNTNDSSPKCMMLYCHWKRTSVFDELGGDGGSATLAQDGPDKISSFRRVDLLPSARPKNKTTLEVGRGGGTTKSVTTESVWYCVSCGDGPMQDWNPICSACGHNRSWYD